jgi:hypothetical protein
MTEVPLNPVGFLISEGFGQDAGGEKRRDGDIPSHYAGFVPGPLFGPRLAVWGSFRSP